MKSSGIITVAGGVGAMVLLGLMVVLRGDAPEPMRTPASGPRAGAASSASAEGAASPRAMLPSPTLGTLPPRPGAAQRPTPGHAQPAQPADTRPSGGTVGSAQAQANTAGTQGEAGTQGSADTRGSAGTQGSAGTVATASEVEKILEVARQAPREDDRINALRWLGENGTPQHFDAMQDIQINDPSAEVRRAAEFAVNELRRRRAHDAWPGVPANKDPQDYMRTVGQPSP